MTIPLQRGCSQRGREFRKREKEYLRALGVFLNSRSWGASTPSNQKGPSLNRCQTSRTSTLPSVPIRTLSLDRWVMIERTSSIVSNPNSWWEGSQVEKGRTSVTSPRVPWPSQRGSSCPTLSRTNKTITEQTSDRYRTWFCTNRWPRTPLNKLEITLLLEDSTESRRVKANRAQET
jgi:hypothetical protein